MVNLDAFFTEHVGNCGKYQLFLSFIINFSHVNTAFVIMGYVFFAATPDHWCSVPAIRSLNLTRDQYLSYTAPLEIRDGQSRYSQCSFYNRNYTNVTVTDVLKENITDTADLPTSSCTVWFYDKSQFESTIVTEWNLVCHRQWIAASTQTVYVVGWIVSAVVAGYLADTYGRRWVFIGSGIGSLVTGVAIAFSNSYIPFMVIRFLQAFTTSGHVQIAYVMVMELVGARARPWMTLFYMEVWAVAYMILAGIAYFIRDYFKLMLITMVPSLIEMFTYCFIPESPRWLFVVGKTKEAMTICRTIAIRNGNPVTEKEFEINNLILDEERTQDHARAKVNPLSLVRTPNLRKKTLIMTYCWCVVTFVYYGLSWNPTTLGGNDYINFFISGAVEMPAYLFNAIIFIKFGRRWPLSISFIVPGLVLMIALAISQGQVAVIIFMTMLGKFFITAAFSMVYQYSAELFPTCLRSISIGICSLCARIGGIIASYVGLLGNISRELPVILFGICSVIAGLLLLMMPETKDAPLLQTVEDGEKFGEDINCFALFLCRCKQKEETKGGNPQTVDLMLTTKSRDFTQM